MMGIFLVLRKKIIIIYEVVIQVIWEKGSI